MKRINVWRLPTNEETEWLKNATPSDFEVFESCNAGDYWVLGGMEEHQLVTGWFDTEEEAQNFINNKGYLEAKWLKDEYLDGFA